MKNNNYLFTSESVSEGHPDKVCDRISDMVVDSYLSKDPVSRVACETLTTTNKVVLRCFVLFVFICVNVFKTVFSTNHPLCMAHWTI